ncbi:hypothetical protein HJB89_25415 [Rhizobium sp. NZLR8]|uniref:hypothetical protein n=1 Tax=Rhizobium sp. NZLR8 TaxID=2731104 RepID=UPI001C83B95A|nr:hypothetical protein [Rhizobium sp. NZLR8]MBX5160427.1 hypothetical protein [Rhizobium sp. NZLR8]
MMTGIRVKKGSLSVFDIGVWEILLANAYEVDPSMERLDYSVSMKALTRFMGKDARAAGVIAAVDRLTDIRLDFGDSDDPHRKFANVPMVTMWEELTRDDHRIEYSFPTPIRKLMSKMPRFAYVELAAIADGSMSSKYSPALYKHLALESHKRKWIPGEANEVFVQLTPAQLADIIGFPRDADGNMNTGKLRDFVDRSIQDLKKVRRFRTAVEKVTESGRGKAIRYYNFTLTLQPPRPCLVPGDKVTVADGGADDPLYQINSGTWAKAVHLFGRGEVFAGYYERRFFEFWLAVLKESLDKKPLSAGYDLRTFRGEGLLAAINESGAEHALWAMLAEEAGDPDLAGKMTYQDRIEGQIGRAERIGAKTTKLKKLIQIEAEAVEREKQQVLAAARAAAEAALVIPAGTGGGEFEDCVKAILQLNDIEDQHWQNIVARIEETRWTGNRKIVLRVYTVSGHHRSTFKISPTKTEWSSLIEEVASITAEVIYQ